MIVELRRYSVRSGCLDRMHRRMRGALLPLFARHGVPNPFAIWASDELTSSATMTWMLEWPSLEIRNTTWAQFRPIWEAAKALQAEEEFVTRTDLSLIASWPGHELCFPRSSTACETAWLVQPRVGLGAMFRTMCARHTFPAFAAAGALAVSATDFVFGPLPQSLILVTWPDPEARRDGMTRLTESPGVPTPDGNYAVETTITPGGTFEPLTRAPYLSTWRLRT